MPVTRGFFLIKAAREILKGTAKEAASNQPLLTPAAIKSGAKDLGRFYKPLSEKDKQTIKKELDDYAVRSKHNIY